MPDDETAIVARIFAQEVPEVAAGIVKIKGIARNPGYRSKLALHSADPHVDCIAVCVGMRGTRIRKIVDQLGGERIDLIRWTDTADTLIRNALQPAGIENVILEPARHRATVVVREEQWSLAVGRRGENQALASRLCGWQIEVVVQ
jgi:N utilization substance protein A